MSRGGGGQGVVGSRGGRSGVWGWWGQGLVEVLGGWGERGWQLRG